MKQYSRRVVITGLGGICPLGSTLEEIWNAIREGRSGVTRLDWKLEACPTFLAGAPAKQFTGEIDDFGPLEKEQKKAIRKGLKVMCRECQLGVAAAQRALADAGFLPGAFDPERCGVSFGADYMLSDPEEFCEGVKYCVDEQGRYCFKHWGTEGMTKLMPLWLLKYLPNMPASHLAIYNDFRGPNNSLTMREASSLAALVEAYQVIRRGDADLMLVGATGTRLHPMKLIHLLGQEEVALHDGDPAGLCRPFDLTRCGQVPGEGAGAIVLEELQTALARQARIYGEVMAAATSAVAGRRLLADRRQAVRNVLHAVLAGATLPVDKLGHIHAHGLATISSDAEEAQAIHDVFSARSHPLPVTAAKSYFGNLGAGGGMVELITSLLALREGRLFPIRNHTLTAPDCPITAVRDWSFSPGDSFIKLNVTLQGQTAAALIRRFE